MKQKIIEINREMSDILTPLFQWFTEQLDKNVNRDIEDFNNTISHPHLIVVFYIKCYIQLYTFLKCKWKIHLNIPYAIKQVAINFKGLTS